MGSISAPGQCQDCRRQAYASERSEVSVGGLLRASAAAHLGLPACPRSAARPAEGGAALACPPGLLLGGLASAPRRLEAAHLRPPTRCAGLVGPSAERPRGFSRHGPPAFRGSWAPGRCAGAGTRGGGGDACRLLTAAPRGSTLWPAKTPSGPPGFQRRM